MMGNNSCASHSVMAANFGPGARVSDNTERLTLLTYDGLVMEVGPASEEQLAAFIAEGGRKGEIYRRLRELRDKYASLIRQRFPQIPRRVSGYNLDELLPEKGFNVARALVGSEGTCAIILDATLKLMPGPRARSLLVLGYPVLLYYSIGRRSSLGAGMTANGHPRGKSGDRRSFWQSVVIGALHCGSGCTVGDILAGTLSLFFPVVLFGRSLYGAWVVEFVFAFVLGIVFQYNSVKPMRNLSPAEGLKAAFKADTLSLTFWQMGMYGWMAIAVFLIFGHELKANDPVFWFMMQIGMLCGFVTACPVNWWLIRKGIKEAM